MPFSVYRNLSRLCTTAPKERNTQDPRLQPEVMDDTFSGRIESAYSQRCDLIQIIAQQYALITDV